MQDKVIHIDAEILGGTPVFYGTRVPIKNLFDYLETGETIETFLQDFDSVSREQVLKVLELSEQLIQSSSSILHENITWWMCYKSSKAPASPPWSGSFLKRNRPESLFGTSQIIL